MPETSSSRTRRTGPWRTAGRWIWKTVTCRCTDELAEIPTSVIPRRPLLNSISMAPSNSSTRFVSLKSFWTTEVEWNTEPCSSSVEPTSADVLRIKFVLMKAIQHTIGTRTNVCEGYKIIEAEKYVSIRPSELRNEDMASVKQSYSIRMMEEFIKTEFPGLKPSLVLDKVIGLVQNSIGSPLPPDRVIDAKLIHGLVLVHHTDFWSEKMLRDEMESNRQGKCVICLDDFDIDLNGSRLPCLHGFHKECLAEWLQISHNCPICRSNIGIEWVPWF